LQSQTRVVKVTQISDTHVTLDGNHPLAGVDLVFDIEVVLVRQATAEELQHGHAHGLHGHAHHH
jgi:FKBP-type peptidyl-prolyl cis-trans isomerase SlyD